MEQLRDFGVRRFTALPYAHKPGVAAYLNDWAPPSRPTCRSACARRRSTPSPAWGSRCRRWSTRASRCSSCTRRWGSSVSTTRCWSRPGTSSRRPAHRRGPHRLGPDRQRVHRPRATCAGCCGDARHCAIIVAHLGAPEYAEFLALAEEYERDPARHHHGLHRLLRGRGAASPTPCCPGWPRWVTRCCSAATSRRSRTPTSTSSRHWPGSGTGTRTSTTTGCARCAGPTRSGCSARLPGPRPLLAGSVVGWTGLMGTPGATNCVRCEPAPWRRRSAWRPGWRSVCSGSPGIPGRLRGLESVDCESSTTQEGLIGFDWGR